MQLRFRSSTKYPLAIVAKALEKISGKKLFGYDIGCAFGETVLYSSLKDTFQNSGSRFCVNVFHGYSHSYDCQCQHHPNIVPGIGIEELETLEQIFSASNQLAPVIRYSSPYRRVSFIHAFFRQWDAEKYANVGLFLYNNYTQALDIIAKNTGTVLAAFQDLGFTTEELAEFDQQERTYFTTLRDEDEGNLWAITYVETLMELQKAKYESYLTHAVPNTDVITARNFSTRPSVFEPTLLGRTTGVWSLRSWHHEPGLWTIQLIYWQHDGSSDRAMYSLSVLIASLRRRSQSKMTSTSSGGCPVTNSTSKQSSISIIASITMLSGRFRD